MAYIFSGIAEPGLIAHTGGPARILVGELDGRRSGRLDAFVAACVRASIDATQVADIRAALWTKYAFICAQAGLTTATRMPIGVIRDTPPTWGLFRAILEEAIGVARAEGVSLPLDIVERQLAMAGSLDPSLYASLHDDLVAGRRIELDALLGELVRRAGRVNVAAPVSAVLYAVLLPQAAGRG